MINAILGVFTIALNHVGLSMLKKRFATLRKLVDGTPVIVVTNRELDHRHLHALRMVDEDVLAAREEGLKHMEDIASAVVERDGSVTVFPKE